MGQLNIRMNKNEDQLQLKQWVDLLLLTDLLVGGLVLRKNECGHFALFDA